MNCPRRWPPTEGDSDSWREDDTCSYCGGLNPAKAITLIENGAEVVTTDKIQKIYVDGKKCYFPHFSQEEARKFMMLYFDRKIRFSMASGFTADTFPFTFCVSD